MSVFTKEEMSHILVAKHTLVNSLESFILTVAKLNTPSILYHKSFFVSGGVIGSLLRNEEPNDIDIYFFHEKLAGSIIHLYTQDESYKNEVEDVNEKYRDVIPNKDGKLITENAVTLKSRLQLITRHYGEPALIRKTFDFVHCLPYYDSRDDKLYISKEQYDLCMNKKLKVNSPANLTKHREEKFKKRGYTWIQTN